MNWDPKVRSTAPCRMSQSLLRILPEIVQSDAFEIMGFWKFRKRASAAFDHDYGFLEPAKVIEFDALSQQCLSISSYSCISYLTGPVLNFFRIFPLWLSEQLLELLLCFLATPGSLLRSLFCLCLLHLVQSSPSVSYSLAFSHLACAFG